MSELPIWAKVETEEEEADRLAGIFLGKGRHDGAVARFVALETVHAIKAALEEEASQFALGVQRWPRRWSPGRLYWRWTLSRSAKKLIKENNLRA